MPETKRAWGGGGTVVVCNATMATAGLWSKLAGAVLDPIIIQVLTESLQFPTMTPVQAAAIPPLLTCKDVSVDAETGSGKTLSFLVPIAQMLLFGKEPSSRHRKPSSCVKAVIIVPTRELASQVHTVAVAFFRLLPGAIKPVPLIGGTAPASTVGGGSNGAGPSQKYASDMRLVIATPGRLNAAISQNAINCSRLDILVLDEADRLLDMGFAVTLTAILTRLPKQRRTGLYSATQTAEVEELARAGLRNPVRVAVRVRTVQEVAVEEDLNASVPASKAQPVVKRQRIPASLTCYYAIQPQSEKLALLLQLLARNGEEKFIVYFITCACVDYHNRLSLADMLAAVEEKSERSDSDIRRISAASRSFFTLHGKLAQARRTKSLEEFAASKNGVLLCTDVAARGIDIPDVDWVVQFDPPQDPDAYIHRVGRTARLGRRGSAVLFLSPYEDAYADFLAVRKCPVQPLLMQCAANAKGDQGTSTPDLAATTVNALVRTAILKDRAVLEASEKAFLSYIRAYKEHKCSYLLKFDNIDVNSIAESFGLLRLPKFHEFKRLRAKIDFHWDKSIKVRDIAFKDTRREAHRQRQIKDAYDNRDERREALEAKSKKKKVGSAKRKRQKKAAKEAAGASRPQSRNAGGAGCTDESEDDFGQEAWQLRKLKRGKLSQEQFETITGFERDNED